MPLPSPNKDEKEKVFISRCIGNPATVEEFPEQEERVAVCYSQWRKGKKDSVNSTERYFTFRLDYTNNSNLRVDESTGFLHAKARLTRSGVFDYYDEAGNLYREHRPDSEVFNNDSINSLQLKPITNDHPDQMVTVENVKDLAVGTIGEKLEKDGIYLSGNIVITDKDMVQTVINRKKAGLQTELSCGYSCNVTPDFGIHNKDGYFTHKQQTIRYNHVGIVDKARAGQNVRILDSKNGNINKTKELKMPDKIQFTRKAISLDSFKMDAITQVVDTESLTLANTLSTKLDEAVDVITSVKKDKDILQGKYDQANETIKSLNAKIDSLSDVNSPQIAEMIKERADVIKVATALKVDCEGKDVKTIKCDCIKAASSSADLENASNDYINGRFDAVDKLIKDQATADGNHKFVNFMQNVTDGIHTPSEDPRAKFINKDKAQNRK